MDPKQRYKSKYTGPQMDVAFERALPGGAIDLSLSNKLTVNASITDMDTTITPGVYTVNGNTVNKPWLLYDATLLVYPSGGWENQAVTQILIDNSNHKQAFRSRYHGTNAWVWTAWAPIATATPPEEYDLPLAGVTGTLKCSKSQDSKVLIPSICVTAAASLSAGATIATLPASYYPSAEKKALADIGGTLGKVIISTAGVITISKAAASGAEICTGSISFVAAS